MCCKLAPISFSHLPADVCLATVWSEDVGPPFGQVPKLRLDRSSGGEHRVLHRLMDKKGKVTILFKDGRCAKKVIQGQGPL